MTPSKPLALVLFGLFMLPLATSCSGAEGGELQRGTQQHSNDADPHEEEGAGEPLELTPEQLAAAGITLYSAGPGVVERRLVLPAIVEANSDARSHVTPKVSGIVRTVLVGLGERVEAGALMCEVDSVELGSVVADYRRARALTKTARVTLERERQRFRDLIEAATENFDGQLSLRRSILEREEELREKQVSTVRPLVEAERAFREAELAKTLGLAELAGEQGARLLALETAVQEREIEEQSGLGHLAALGITGDQVEALATNAEVYAGTYSIRATRSGVITSRSLAVGEYVEVGRELFEIQDLSKVWVVASAFEGSLRWVAGGQQARVVLHAFPGVELVGEVVLVGYRLDVESRALDVRVELDNEAIAAWGEELPLRPGMFGEVRLVIESRMAPLTLPEGALVHSMDADAVFVRTADGHFEKRLVEVLGGDADLVEVRPLDGRGPALEAGDLVAVGGAFTLKSMDQADTLVGDHDH